MENKEEITDEYIVLMEKEEVVNNQRKYTIPQIPS